MTAGKTSIPDRMVRPPGSHAEMGENAWRLSMQSCLEKMGISLLSEWDVLVFLHRHDPSLMSVDHIAVLIGYENTLVNAALDRLERLKLIRCSAPIRGVRIHRTQMSIHATQSSCFQQMFGLSENRAGRLLLAKLLKTVELNLSREEQLAES
jgi:hypothetical protein